MRALHLHGGVGVRSASAEALDGLLEFFSEWVEPSSLPETWVRCDVDAERYTALGRRVAGAPGAPLEMFTLDTETLCLPAWKQGPATLAFDALCECFLELGADGLLLTTHPGARLARLGLLRVVREAVCARSRGAAVLDLHAAAVEVDGRAVLICGPKRAGKSSLLCHLLSTGRARYLANDRVRLCLQPGGVVARGIPTMVRLRPPTVRGLPAWLPASDDLTLSPAQLCARLGARAVLQAPLGAVLHPRISADAAPPAAAWTLQSLDADEARSALRASLYGVPSARPTAIAQHLGGAAPASPARTARDLASLADGTPQLACRLGPSAYATSAAALLEALGELWQPA